MNFELKSHPLVPIENESLGQPGRTGSLWRDETHTALHARGESFQGNHRSGAAVVPEQVSSPAPSGSLLDGFAFAIGACIGLSFYAAIGAVAWCVFC